ncbi:beta-mannosidase [Alkalispirochaeta americana]|uniref:beta-mannosidase n=1 Tax=Alkalispirochaeta americana TaxID=159291 RepID=A0A1N6VTY6_9SPIO|nr:glycoside hydrolase family 2 protein [Alkalispirochaeta americana]SIQ81323.1 beta-mannosidase [Alkalispirochaeta americana]
MIDLSGLWQLRDLSGEHRLSMNVPGDVYTALLDEGIISDPYWAQNELDLQWPGREDWVLEREFSLERYEPGERWIFFADSVDTAAEMYLNGELLWSGSNMFVPLRVEAGDLLRQGVNRIRLVLKSPEEESRRRAEILPYTVPHTAYPVQSPHRNLLRKVQCHSGWDWGPCLMTSGVYGSIGISREPEWSLCAAWGIPLKESGDRWRLKVFIEGDYQDIPGEEMFGRIPAVKARLLDQEGVVVAETDQVRKASQREEGRCASSASGLHPRRTRLEVDLVVDDPRLWWPSGYGDQPLYRLQLDTEGGYRELTTAFRTIEVVNKPDQWGVSFFFRVNGRDIWAKGANWIPLDALPARQSYKRYRQLLEDARAAHMNMIRLWGGGQYEQDCFYDLCDELGILVWQDFMFSCSLYPSEEWFLEEVRQEVSAQVRRLASHPSIALWCGNNENVGALGWFPESRENRERYVIDYDRLNTGVIAKVVRSLDESRIFWPSSPAAGEGNFSDNWHDDSCGDMHYWSVWHEGAPFSAYYKVVPRFCSEFGFQSFPSLSGIARFAPPDQWNPTAPDLEHHQRSPRGNAVVSETMTRYFRVPFDFQDFIYLSQVQQAWAIKNAVSFWRSRRPQSMGALFWQLNDLWPVVSWSSIEYDGRWKMLHHEARRFFAPSTLICQVHQDAAEVWCANDDSIPLEGKVLMRFLDWQGHTLREEMRTVQVPPDSVAEVARYDVKDMGFAPHQGFLVAQWEGSQRVERDWTFLTEPKRCELLPPVLEVRSQVAPPSGEGSGFVWELSCDAAPAFWVFPDFGDTPWRAGDAGFLLLPGETRSFRVTFPEEESFRRASGEHNLEDPTRLVRVRHLASACHGRPDSAQVKAETSQGR